MKNTTVIRLCVVDTGEPGKEFVIAMRKCIRCVSCANRTENLQPQRRSIIRCLFRKVAPTQEII